jgi:sulfite reductase (ferredoxin)
VLGGKWQENAGSYGLAIGAVPAKAVPDLLDEIINLYAAGRQPGETFQDWVTRLGKKEVRAILEPFMQVPPYEEKRSFYSDWGDPREFTLGDMGAGECAGEVVSLFSLEIAKAEAEAFEALVALDERDYVKADALAYRAMLAAARALVRNQFLDVGEEPERIVSEFKTRFYDTKLFFDKYASNKFAQYFFQRHEHPPANPDQSLAQRLIEETNLFIEACHACDARMAGATTGGVRM